MGELLKALDPLLEPLMVLLAVGVAMRVALAKLQERVDLAISQFHQDRAEVKAKLVELEKAIDEEHAAREAAFQKAVDRLYERLYDRENGTLRFVTAESCEKNHAVYRTMCEALSGQMSGMQAQLSSTQEMVRMLVVEPTAKKAHAYNGLTKED